MAPSLLITSSRPIQIARSFRWLRPLGGYRTHTVHFPNRSPDGDQIIIDEWGAQKPVFGLKDGDRCLAPVTDTVFEICSPLTDSSLFRQFASLECTESAVVGFAKKNGLLRWSRRQTRWEDGRPMDGEAFQSWYWLIRQMALAVHLWEASRAESEASFKRIAQGADLNEAWKALDIMNPELSPRKEPRELLKPSEALLIAHSIVLGELGDRLLGGASARLSFAEARPGKYVLEIGPDSLMSGLWLQFAVAMADDAKFKSCAYEKCDRFIDTTQHAKSKLYCSGSCRTRACIDRDPSEKQQRKPNKSRRSKA